MHSKASYTNKILSKESICPLNLVDVKHYLRIDDSYEDELLNELIKTVIEKFEDYTSYALTENQWHAKYINPVTCNLLLPKTPVIKIHSITGETFSATKHPLTHFTLETKENMIILQQFPLYLNILVEFTSGNACTASIKQALINHVGYLYENRATSKQYPLSNYDEFRIMRL